MARLFRRKAHYGLTQHGVYEAIIDFAGSQINQGSPLSRALDIPCGQGEFLHAFQDRYYLDSAVGADISPVDRPQFEFRQVDITRGFGFPGDEKYDLVTCISGIPEFDNTTAFIGNCKMHLKPDGWLIVSNDNSFTVRDRVSYLLSGRLRRYSLMFVDKEPTYRHVPIQELSKIFSEQGLELHRVQYLSLRSEDLIWLPLACLIYPFQWLYLRRLAKKFGRRSVRMLFPFSALLQRHYILYAKIRSGDSSASDG